MHIQNCCTRNGDHLNLLIKSGNGHKQRILAQTTINTFKSMRGRDRNTVKNDGGQIVVIFTITEINYLVVSQFCDLVRPLSYLYL